MDAHLHRLLQRQTGIVPSRHSPNQVSGELGESRADEEWDNLIHVFVFIENQQNRIVWIDQPSGPDGKHGGSANVDCPLDMTSAKGQHGSGVDQNDALLSL